MIATSPTMLKCIVHLAILLHLGLQPLHACLHIGVCACQREDAGKQQRDAHQNPAAQRAQGERSNPKDCIH